MSCKDKNRKINNSGGTTNRDSRISNRRKKFPYFNCLKKNEIQIFTFPHIFHFHKSRAILDTQKVHNYGTDLKKQMTKQMYI